MHPSFQKQNPFHSSCRTKYRHPLLGIFSPGAKPGPSMDNSGLQITFSHRGTRRSQWTWTSAPLPHLDVLYVRHRVEGMDGMPQLGLSPHSTAVQGVVLNSQTICSTSIPLPKPGTKLYFKESNFRNKNSLCPVREGKGKEVTSNKGLLCARGHTHDTAISLYYIWIWVYSCVHLLYELCIHAHTWQELCTVIPLLYTGIVPNLCAHICPQVTKKIHTTT